MLHSLVDSATDDDAQNIIENEHKLFVYLANNSFLCNRFRAIAVRNNRESLVCCVVTITI